jgi:DNA-directed RNA polymerase subunit RPC12/RpoP
MAAHLRAIFEPKCMRCGRKATDMLHNTRNEEIGPYCRKCGAAAVKELQREERRHHEQR